MRKIKLLALLIVSIQTINSQPVICTSEFPVLYDGSFFWQTNTGTCAPLSDGSILWDNGTTIYFKFLNGSKALQDSTIKYFKEIEQYANIKFQVTNTVSHCRIEFTHNSIIQTDISNACLLRTQEEVTCKIDSSNFYKNLTVYKRLVLHTVGHILGLQDEVYVSVAKGDVSVKSKMNNRINNLYQSEQSKFKSNHSNQLKYDPHSIMVIPAVNKHTSYWNNDLSVQDKKLLSILYPKNNSVGASDTPAVLQFKNLLLLKNGESYVFTPQFDITVFQNCTLHFLLFFTDANGNLITHQAMDKIYNLDGYLGTYLTIENNIAGRYVVNNAMRDIQLSIPIQIISNYQQKPTHALLKVFAINKNAEKGKWIFEGKPVKIYK